MVMFNTIDGRGGAYRRPARKKTPKKVTLKPVTGGTKKVSRYSTVTGSSKGGYRHVPKAKVAVKPAPKRSAPVSRNTSRSTSRSSGGGTTRRRSSGGGGTTRRRSSGGSIATTAAAAPKVAAEPKIKMLSQKDWNAKDSSYLAEEASLKAARDAALAEIGLNRGNYQNDYGQTLKNMGYRWEDANNNGIADKDELKGGTWDRDNQQGAYGQAYKNTLDDFTGRGMLGSSFYSDAMTEMQRGFDNQYSDLATARAQRLAELLGEENAATSSYGSGLEQAKANAAQRRALEYNL